MPFARKSHQHQWHLSTMIYIEVDSYHSRYFQDWTILAIRFPIAHFRQHWQQQRYIPEIERGYEHWSWMGTLCLKELHRTWWSSISVVYLHLQQSLLDFLSLEILSAECIHAQTCLQEQIPGSTHTDRWLSWANSMSSIEHLYKHALSRHNISTIPHNHQDP